MHTAGQHPQPQEEFSLTDADFRLISELVLDKTGIVLREEKRPLVYARLAKRLRQLHLKSFKEYCQLVMSEKGQNELPSLINAITTNLTRFFREEHHFEYLQNEVIPYFIERQRNNPSQQNRKIRIWSAGCSSGEEPYSIAMTFAEHLPNGFDLKILATDIDTNMVSHASAGIYHDVKGVPEKYINSYTQKLPNGRYEIKKNIRDMITFKPLNLLEYWPMKGPFDIIFCRNVVIYFNKDTQATLFNRMADLIPEGQWLFIGHSENLFRVTNKFNLTGRTIYQRNNQ